MSRSRPAWVQAAAVVAVLGISISAAAAAVPQGLTLPVPATDRAQGQIAALRDDPARPGELIVGIAPGAQRGMAAAFGAAGARAGRGLGHGLQLVTVTPGREGAAAAVLAARPEITSVDRNYLRPALSHVGAEVGWGVRRSRAPRLWERATPLTGQGVDVAVLDSGVDSTVGPELAGRVESGYNAFTGSSTGTSNDDCGHGTAVAGVVAAAHDGDGTVGMAPDATIVPVKVLQWNGTACVGDDASLVAGLNWVSNYGSAAPPRAEIANMSIGGPPSRALGAAVAYAADKGLLMVAASGNSGDRLVNYPAGFSDVISVGGVERADGDIRWWRHSTFGKVDVVSAAKRVPVLVANTIGRDEGRIARPCDGGAQMCSDGTSFASPHVAGMAALLAQQHAAEMADLSAGNRVRRLRQWVIATAHRVRDSRHGVDLFTGRGEIDAVDAANASIDPARVLLTWRSRARIISPTSLMRATPSVLPATVVVTRGTGQPLANTAVTFTPPARGSARPDTATTNASGTAGTDFRSTAASHLSRIKATVAGKTLGLDAYVLERDDNIPGISPPASPFRDALDFRIDFDDVLRFRLRSGQTLRAEVDEVARYEFVDMYLHRGNERNVMRPRRAPIEEDGGFWNKPKSFAKTVCGDGTRFLDVVGFGSYRMKWWVRAPQAVNCADASPEVITPNGDGYRDSTKITWDAVRTGQVEMRIRDDRGRLVRDVSLGRQTDGRHAYRWSGRSDEGKTVGSGVYVVTVLWTNDGDVARTSTNVRVIS